MCLSLPCVWGPMQCRVVHRANDGDVIRHVTWLLCSIAMYFWLLVEPRINKYSSPWLEIRYTSNGVRVVASSNHIYTYCYLCMCVSLFADWKLKLQILSSLLNTFHVQRLFSDNYEVCQAWWSVIRQTKGCHMLLKSIKIIILF